MNIWWLSSWKKFIEQTQSPHPFSLLEILKPQFLIQLITRGALNGSCYCYCNAALYCAQNEVLWMTYKRMANKLLRGKIGCNLRRSLIPFVVLLILLLVCSLNKSLLCSCRPRSFCVCVSLTLALQTL